MEVYGGFSYKIIREKKYRKEQKNCSCMVLSSVPRNDACANGQKKASRRMSHHEKDEQRKGKTSMAAEGIRFQYAQL